MTRTPKIFKKWFLLLPDQSDGWVPSYKSYFIFADRDITPFIMFFETFWWKMLCKSQAELLILQVDHMQEQILFSWIYKIVFNHFVFLSHCAVCIVRFAYYNSKAVLRLLPAEILPCSEYIWATWEYSGNYLPVCFLCRKTLSLWPLQCGLSHSVLVLAFDFLLSMPPVKTKNTWNRLFSCLSQSKKKMDSNGKQAIWRLTD